LVVLGLAVRNTILLWAAPQDPPFHLVQFADDIQPHVRVWVPQQVEEHWHQVLDGWLLAQLRRQLHNHAC
jgi:hypothetical protein